MKRMLPSPAMAVALLALLVALGGTTYAAVKLKRNSVGAKQIKPNAVRNSELGDNAVGTGELAPSAVNAAKLADNAVRTGKLADNAVRTGKLADNAVNSAKIADGSIARGDSPRGTLVAAYARINQANLVEAAIAPGTAVNVIDVDDAGNGHVIISFGPQALPGGSIATCTITATPISSVAGLSDPSPKTVVIDPIDPGSLSASSVEAQTHGFFGTPPQIGTTESDFFIQASCPPG